MRFTPLIVGWALAVTAISAIAGNSDAPSAPRAAPAIHR